MSLTQKKRERGSDKEINEQIKEGEFVLCKYETSL